MSQVDEGIEAYGLFVGDSADSKKALNRFKLSFASPVWVPAGTWFESPSSKVPAGRLKKYHAGSN
jgi:hypothetical protein